MTTASDRFRSLTDPLTTEQLDAIIDSLSLPQREALDLAVHAKDWGWEPTLVEAYRIPDLANPGRSYLVPRDPNAVRACTCGMGKRCVHAWAVRLVERAATAPLFRLVLEHYAKKPRAQEGPKKTSLKRRILSRGAWPTALAIPMLLWFGQPLVGHQVSTTGFLAAVVVGIAWIWWTIEVDRDRWVSVDQGIEAAVRRRRDLADVWWGYVDPTDDLAWLEGTWLEGKVGRHDGLTWLDA